MANGNGKEQVAAKRIVVFTHKGMATVKEGGSFFGIEDGGSITCEEFGKKIPVGVVCHHNPAEEEPVAGPSYRRSMIRGAVNRARQ